MPKKKNGSGSLQEYLPSGSGEHGGEYANPEGSNKHFSTFAKADGGISLQEDTKQKKSQKQSNVKEKPTAEEKVTKVSKETKEKLKEVQPIKKTIKAQIDAYSDEDCKELLVNDAGLDEEAIKELSSEELHNLALAYKNTLQKEKNNKTKYLKQLKEFNDEHFIWYSLDNINSPEDLESSIDKKKEYFEHKIYKITNALDLGEIPEEQVKDYKKNIEQLQHTIDELYKTEEILEAWKKDDSAKKHNDLIKSSKDLVESFIDKNNLYSQHSKDNALWFGSLEDAKKEYGSWYKNFKQNIDPEDLKKVQAYTSSYHFINEPLRKLKYSSFHKKEEFVPAVEGMTKAIDKCEIPKSMWVQRGVTYLNIDGIDVSSYNIESLVGSTFEDQGFVSCGSHKGGGFTGKSVIMNIYCPKGTKAIYAQPFSSFSNEDETIIQRGYTYKITKAEKKDGVTYLDCEVVLGSDSKKYSSEQLKELANKYFTK